MFRAASRDRLAVYVSVGLCVACATASPRRGARREDTRSAGATPSQEYVGTWAEPLAPAPQANQESGPGPEAPSGSREPWLSPPLSVPLLLPLVNQAIARNELPGCVIVAGTSEGIGLLEAYGRRSLEPPEPMTTDTFFDVASVTKPLATTSALMRLEEMGVLNVNARVVKYLPKFGALGKGNVLVKQLLTHTSGLPRVNPRRHYDDGTQPAFSHIFALRLAHPVGQVFNYSDVGFILLGHLVEKLSGRPLDEFVASEIFEPLHLEHTRFLPPSSAIAQTAPTEKRDNVTIRGVVDDPRAYRLGGVAGNAGLFSDAHDVARFSRMLLRGGELDGVRIFREDTLKRWTTPQPAGNAMRALGWDSRSGYARGRGRLMGPNTYGHSGYTGVSGWIDPDRDMYVWLLSNRVHSGKRSTIYPLAGSVSDLVVRALDRRHKPPTKVQTGIDVLQAQAFAPLRGRKVVLLTNGAARNRENKRSADLFRDTRELQLKALWTPEHGLTARREGHVNHSRLAGLPVYSLFGKQRDPTDHMLHGAEAIVVDLQDVGARFYTYAATVGRVLAFAAARGLAVWVLDRPNPLGGMRVAGPINEPEFESFVNHHPLPIEHGLTMGELARLLARERNLPVNLAIVPLSGWRRDMLFPDTGLTWRAPSPNLRRFEQVVLYPAVALVEGTNVSVGRGTDTPFEVVGAPYVDADALLASLRAAQLPGLRLETARFRPRSARHRGQWCQGVRLHLVDPAAFDPMRTGLALIRALMPLRPAWDDSRLPAMVAEAQTLRDLAAGSSEQTILSRWAQQARAFEERRKPVLLYPEEPRRRPRGGGGEALSGSSGQAWRE